MGIGASIFLIVVGAILTFALNVSIGALDLNVVGWILMVGGLGGLIFTAFILAPRRRAITTTRTTGPTARTTEPTEYVQERTDL